MRKFIVLFIKEASDQTSLAVVWVEVLVFYWAVPGACTGPNIGYCV
jgi:hypothetical protein